MKEKGDNLLYNIAAITASKSSLFLEFSMLIGEIFIYKYYVNLLKITQKYLKIPLITERNVYIRIYYI